MTSPMRTSVGLQEKKRPVSFHPWLIGVYPFLTLLAHNLSQVEPVLTLRALAATLLVIGLVVTFARLAVRDSMRAGMLASLFLAFFFSYGHLYGALEGKSLAGLVVGRHLLLAPLWLALLVGMGWLVLARMRGLETWTRLLNLVGVALVLLPALQSGASLMNSRPQGKRSAQALAEAQPGQAELPDVYYIILDAYSRADLLEKYQGLDVTPFLDELRGMGFYVASCSQSNYGITALSLPSSLNMNYVEEVAPDIVAQDLSWDNFSDFILHSEVRSKLEGLGYRTISFETGIPWDEMTDASVYYARAHSPAQVLLDFRQVTAFETLYLRTTALRMADELRARFGIRLAGEIRTPERDHHDRILYVLDRLEETPELPGPKFVFLHLMSPHGPFVLAPDGSYSFTGDDDPGYTNAIRYLDSRLPGIFKKILSESKVPPVIIIQGDHGYYLEERMAILNAYYFPGDGARVLYPTISPVNSFRLMFNQYFGGNYTLLPDRSLLSDRNDPYQFEEVSYPCDSE